jgi:hypothetical protein
VEGFAIDLADLGVSVKFVLLVDLDVVIFGDIQFGSWREVALQVGENT